MKEQQYNSGVAGRGRGGGGQTKRQENERGEKNVLKSIGRNQDGKRSETGLIRNQESPGG